MAGARWAAGAQGVQFATASLLTTCCLLLKPVLAELA